MKATIVPGHGLQFEGRAYDDDARWVLYGKTGRGLCSCGELSPVLPSIAARKRWHREHKAEVKARG